jgi:hypothetical protein
MLAAPGLTGSVPVCSAAATDMAQLRAHSGEVLIRRGKAGAGSAPTAITPLYRRDEVETHAGGTATVDLPSGMVVELGPNSLLAIIGGGNNVDGFLARGAVSVTPPADHEPRQVQFATPYGRVDLRVREGRVELAGDHLLVQVTSGTAEVVAHQQKVSLTAGQEVEVRAGGVLGTPRPLTAARPAAMPPETPVAVTPPAPVPPPPAPTPPAVVSTHPETPTSVAPTPPPADVPVMAPSAAVAPPKAVVADTQPPVAVPPPVVHPEVAPERKEPIIGFTTLNLLRQKGIISQAEFDSALRDMHDTVGPRGADNVTLVVGKWATTLYGFVQADFMWHSTQSFNDFGSNFQVARPGTLAGDNGRFEGSIRDSRIGLRIAPPELSWLRASAVFELDLLGPTGTVGTTITEGSFFVNPVLRVRHAYFKAETPVIDILFGQYWHLFGWQPHYVPAVVQWPGIVGELFSRTTQLRLSKTVKTKPVTFEIAVAGMRPPQRDSSVPEFEAGMRLSFNKWTAAHSLYMTSTSTMPASIAISGDLRRFTLPELSAMPQSLNSKVGLGIAGNIFLPIIPGTKERKDNSLAIIGEFVYGQGISDLYTGLTGGVANPSVPMAGGTMGTYNSDADAGLAVYDMYGNMQLPTWMTFLVGAEYWLPKVGGRVALFANFSRTQLQDAKIYVNPTRVRDNEMFYNGGFLVDVTGAIRVGVDYARYDDQYADGVHAINDAVQVSGFLFF